MARIPILRNKDYLELMLLVLSFDGSQEKVVSNYVQKHNTTKENVYLMIKNISGKYYSFLMEDKSRRVKAKGVNKKFLNLDYEGILKEISIMIDYASSIKSNHPLLLSYLQFYFDKIKDNSYEILAEEAFLFNVFEGFILGYSHAYNRLLRENKKQGVAKTFDMSKKVDSSLYAFMEGCYDYFLNKTGSIFSDMAEETFMH